MKGKVIILEGNDASGKSSQCKLIKEYLTSIGLSNTQFHFPTYTHNEFGKVITSFLQGNFGAVPYFSLGFMLTAYLGVSLVGVAAFAVIAAALYLFNHPHKEEGLLNG